MEPELLPCVSAYDMWSLISADTSPLCVELMTVPTYRDGMELREVEPLS